MIRVYCIFILIWAMTYGLNAGVISITGRAEVGGRSTGEDYQEEGGDAEYRYQTYYFRFEQYLNPRITYNLTGSFYKRDYQSNISRNNTTNTFTGNGTYVFSPLLAMNLFVKYRDKYYDHNPAADYQHFACLPTVKVQVNRSHSGGILLGLNRYRYLKSGETHNNALAKLYGRGYYLNDRLVCISSYQVQTLGKERMDKKKNKQMLMAGAACRFDLPLFYKLTARINYGEQDTKDNETQDIDYDYRAINYYLRGDFKIRHDLKTNFAWQKFKKDYVSYQRDHRGYMLRNGWDFYPVRDKRRSFWFNLDLSYKWLTFLENPDSGYNKEELIFKINYRRKAYWKISCSYAANLYQYENDQSDKNRYYGYLSWEQDLMANRGLLTIDLKYRYTRYFHRANETSLGTRIGFSYHL